MAVGERTSAADASHLLGPSCADSKRMGALLSQARRIASTVTTGGHPLRRHGAGENFWQFRPYQAGEPTTRIDWRRSARDNHITLREREREVAQTIHLCPDLSASMCYRSRDAHRAKDEHALLLTLALADIFCRNGERIAIPGLLPSTYARNGAERAAIALTQTEDTPRLADMARIGRFGEIIIISDFLLPDKDISTMTGLLAERQARAHLIAVADPAEAQFPFRGRVTFQDPESGARLTAGNAQSYRKDYRRLYQARRDWLATLCRHHQWGFYTSQTDRPVLETLRTLLVALNERKV
ncbi:MAG: Hypothetical protein BHV28_04850 [Candidatus Tokpelaia hoelldobleri]|uniref:DUF58 domain-containing protein n=1 Tax=Candidatus Tokpelaia hoelldobleri TaxID=1902579 RepID=A0A1U9JTL2_9HYPH|nr:MAG: Hypothetical protein BHV28_04850 [Candidatus Tokpelaia hoelldoblerii]